MNSGHWQAIAAGAAVAIFVVGALMRMEQRLAHLEDSVLTPVEVREIFGRLISLEGANRTPGYGRSESER